MKKIIANKEHPRAALADETAGTIDKIMSKVIQDLSHAYSELSQWQKSRGYLMKIIKTYGEQSEEKALLIVADRNIDNWESQVLMLEEQEKSLIDYAGRVQLAKNSFDIFDGTRYLMEKSGSGVQSIKSPETELMEIRRAVYSIEGYKEILG